MFKTKTAEEEEKEEKSFLATSGSTLFLSSNESQIGSKREVGLPAGPGKLLTC